MTTTDLGSGTIKGQAVFARTPSHYFPALVGLFVGVMLISNITATKGVVFFSGLSFELGPVQIDGIVTDGAFFLFPLAYILGDVISEVYGFKAMRRTVYTGFAILLLASVCFWLTVELPAASFYDGQEALERVVGVVPQIVLAGLMGYLVGELLNSYVLVKIKEKVGEKQLWVRLIGSTVVGQTADTLVFCSIAATAIGISTWGDFINFVVVGIVWKTLIEVVVLPLTYLVVGWLKRSEPTYQDALATARTGDNNVTRP